jgi:hypothetical protein
LVERAVTFREGASLALGAAFVAGLIFVLRRLAWLPRGPGGANRRWRARVAEAVQQGFLARLRRPGDG